MSPLLLLLATAAGLLVLAAWWFRPIVQAIAVAHGGSAVLDSVPGRGTTVTVSLPLEPARSPGGAPAYGAHSAEPMGWFAQSSSCWLLVSTML